MLVENTALVAAWHCYRVPGAWYDDSVVPVVSTTFLVGQSSMHTVSSRVNFMTKQSENTRNVVFERVL